MRVKLPVGGQFVRRIIRGGQSRRRREALHALSLSVTHSLCLFFLSPVVTSFFFFFGAPSLSGLSLSIEVRADVVGMWSKGRRWMYGGTIIGSGREKLTN